MINTYFISSTALERHSVDDLEDLRARDDGFIWLDVPKIEEGDAEILVDRMNCHPVAVETCKVRNHVATLYPYPNQTFLILHGPERGEPGKVHIIELDVFIGKHLVTVHGPVSRKVDAESAMRDTASVLARMEGGSMLPRSPVDLASRIFNAVARRQRRFLDEVAKVIPHLEKRVRHSNLRHPEDLLQDMFMTRYELLVARTMSAQSHEVMARAARLTNGPEHTDEDHQQLDDLADQFDRMRRLGEGERDFLIGAIEQFQSRVTTKMSMAGERLAVLAAVTLPITAISGIVGMNVIVRTSTNFEVLGMILALMLVISVVLLHWTRRQGWW